MKRSTLTWTVIFVVFMGVFVYAVRDVVPFDVREKQSQEAPPVVSDTNTATYINTNDGYRVHYPKDFILATSTEDDLFNKGVSFVVPPQLTTGTNLATDSRIYIEKLAASSTCVAAGKDPIITEEAGAGNFYHSLVYTKGQPGMCYEITLFVHSMNIANYEPGAVVSFDQDVLDKAIKTVVDSFTITS